MSRTTDHALARRQLAPFKKGTRVLLSGTIGQRGSRGTVESTVISRRTVRVRLDEGGIYGAWPENLTIEVPSANTDTRLKPANRARLLRAAREMYADPSSDDIEIPEDARIDANRSRGFWVEAVVYVRAEDLK